MIASTSNWISAASHEGVERGGWDCRERERERLYSVEDAEYEAPRDVGGSSTKIRLQDHTTPYSILHTPYSILHNLNLNLNLNLN
jgi:hypothetical protein